jgi:hypothetical protein
MNRRYVGEACRRGDGLHVHGNDVHESTVLGIKARFEVNVGVAGDLGDFILVVNLENAGKTSLFSWPSNRKRITP